MIYKLLEFNPYFRWSAQECLRSPYFDKIRNPALEKHSKAKILLEIDQDDAFDYVTAESPMFDKDKFLQIIWKNAQMQRIKR
jgi:hypothetical protein